MHMLMRDPHGNQILNILIDKTINMNIKYRINKYFLVMVLKTKYPWYKVILIIYKGSATTMCDHS